MAVLELRRRDLAAISGGCLLASALGAWAAVSKLRGWKTHDSGPGLWLEHLFSPQAISLLFAAFSLLFLAISLLAYSENRLKRHYIITKDEVRALMVGKQIVHKWDEIGDLFESRGKTGRKLTFRLTDGQRLTSMPISMPIDRLSASRTEILDFIRSVRPGLPISLLSD